MLIKDVINQIKKYHRAYASINPVKTRDQVLYGTVDKQCTGLVTTIWASSEVIEKAHALNCNLIICHEALFWNHGDHQDWLLETNNSVYSDKKALLDAYGITVWRNHDHIHSGIPYQDGWIDGIFYGFAKKMDWLQYADPTFVKAGIFSPTIFTLPPTSVREVAKKMCKVLNLNNVKIVGALDTPISKVWICGHNFGDAEDMITFIEQNQIDLVMPLEMIDFTLLEYIKDANLLNHHKAIITAGHFNTEEPGMEYMLEYLPTILPKSIPTYYIQAGDTYNYLSK